MFSDETIPPLSHEGFGIGILKDVLDVNIALKDMLSYISVTVNLCDCRARLE